MSFAILRAVDEIRVSEALAVVQNGNDYGGQAEDADLLRFWHRAWQGVLCWIFCREHAQNAFRLNAVGDGVCSGGH